MDTEDSGSTELTRREMLKWSGATVGGLAVGRAMIGSWVGSAGAGDEQGTSAFKDSFQCMEGFS